VAVPGNDGAEHDHEDDPAHAFERRLPERRLDRYKRDQASEQPPIGAERP
jgi:hypothetical protein